MRVIVNVQLKNGVLDPQGKAVHHALSSLKFSGVNDVRIGKQIILEIAENDMNKAKEDGKKIGVATQVESTNLIIQAPKTSAGKQYTSKVIWTLSTGI